MNKRKANTNPSNTAVYPTLSIILGCFLLDMDGSSWSDWLLGNVSFASTSFMFNADKPVTVHID